MVHARFALKKREREKKTYKSIALRQSFSKLVRRLYLPTKEHMHARTFIAWPSIATRIKGDCCHARYPRVATSRVFQGLETKWAVVRRLL